MEFFINHRSGVPIYKQLVQQIEKGLAGRLLKPGDQLPTVREMALNLTVNPNTVARAYRELEVRGMIVSVQGRGTFISEEIASSMVEEREIMIQRLLHELVREARQLGLTPHKLEALFQEVLEAWKRGNWDDEA